MLFLMLFAAAAVTVSAAPQKVDFDKLPKNSQEFVQKNFPRETVRNVEMDREASWDKYTVYFNSGAQVSFEGGSGDCSEIIMKNGSVPANLVPVKIKSYVNNHYNQSQIRHLAMTKDGYKVGLSNGTLLYFDKNADFKNVDKK